VIHLPSETGFGSFYFAQCALSWVLIPHLRPRALALGLVEVAPAGLSLDSSSSSRAKKRPKLAAVPPDDFDPLVTVRGHKRFLAKFLNNFVS